MFYFVKKRILYLCGFWRFANAYDGEVRKEKLGAYYDDVQGVINHIREASTDTLVAETLEGEYGTGQIRKTVLDSRYTEVQNKINAAAGGSVKTYTVKAGDTLSGIAAKYNTTYKQIAEDNKLSDPNKIYVGQKLVIR